jgi:hypothetical protein
MKLLELARFSYIIMNHLNSYRLLLAILIALSSTQSFSLEVAGTAERSEVEYKMAYWTDSNFSSQNVAVKIRNAISETLQNKEYSKFYQQSKKNKKYRFYTTSLDFSKNKKALSKLNNEYLKMHVYKNDDYSFSNLIKKNYFIPPVLQEFVFKDIYFDTSEYSLLKNSSVYRLRYRWNKIREYFYYQYLPFLSRFYPNRCEIQAKTNYHSIDDKITSLETRFEFHPDAYPFIHGTPGAPTSPWPIEDFTNTARVGKWLMFKLLPFHSIEKYIQTPLFPTLEVIMTRLRFHLNLDTPWGSGRNLDNVFIVTIDHGYARCLKFCKDKHLESKKLLEIEIEIDRNISRNIELILLGKVQEKFTPAFQNQLIRSTKLAKKDIDADFEKVRNIIRKVINKNYPNLEALPITFKYKRFIDQISSKNQIN